MYQPLLTELLVFSTKKKWEMFPVIDKCSFFGVSHLVDNTLFRLGPFSPSRKKRNEQQ